MSSPKRITSWVVKHQIAFLRCFVPVHWFSTSNEGSGLTFQYVERCFFHLAHPMRVAFRFLFKAGLKFSKSCYLGHVCGQTDSRNWTRNPQFHVFEVWSLWTNAIEMQPSIMCVVRKPTKFVGLRTIFAQRLNADELEPIQSRVWGHDCMNFANRFVWANIHLPI